MLFKKNPKEIIFLESSTKKNTISDFLKEKSKSSGIDYVIFATGGHLMNIVNQGYYNLGIDLETFKPTYGIIEEKKKLINFWKNYLKKNSFDKIYLATDPDREGEAIACEIAKILNIKDNEKNRLLFYEITFDSINESLKNPTFIKNELVEAQTSRQVLDRIIGFCLSTLLRKKMKAISAGRVQSLVLKLIVEREKLLHDYNKKKEYLISASKLLGNDSIIFKNVDENLEVITYENEKEATLKKNKIEADKLFKLVEKKVEEKYILPKPPLITSLMLYEAEYQLGFSAQKTTSLAQKLYEKGLISYPRTDSIRINKIFISKIYSFIEKTFGKGYCNFSPAWKKISEEKKLNVQDAHEGIRPTYLEYLLKDKNNKFSLDKDELKLYNLIFDHTIASFMSPAKANKLIYHFLNGDYHFKTTELVLTSWGFLKKMDKFFSFNRYNLSEKEVLGELKEVLFDKLEVSEYLKKKPTRYNEGNLVRELERLGVGRPSTYNTFGKIIQERRYALLNKKQQFVPTELGVSVNDWIQENFSYLINEKYTASLEKELDKISQGENNYFNFIKEFWIDFNENLKKFSNI